jgi:hypothetical protein
MTTALSPDQWPRMREFLSVIAQTKPDYVSNVIKEFRYLVNGYHMKFSEEGRKRHNKAIRRRFLKCPNQ